MRELLFRGRTESGKWWYGDAHRNYNGIVSTIITDGCWKTETIETQCAGYFGVVPETVGQFVGLLDKKSTKIFEGDIVKATINCGGEICYAVGAVIFENGTFKLKVFQSKNTAEYKRYTSANAEAYSLEHNFIERRYLLEVIGNIHDSPELLRGVK